MADVSPLVAERGDDIPTDLPIRAYREFAARLEGSIRQLSLLSESALHAVRERSVAVAPA